MKFRFWAIIFIIFITNTDKLPAQSSTKTSIAGHVIDDSTRKPLQFVNVFIANTSLGSTTDQNGFYLIRYVPLGTYDLIASMMGYELEKLSIRLIEPTDKQFNFSLKPRVLPAPEIEVTATYPHEWKKNLKRFERLFLGTLPNAARCKIMNPEVLNFEEKKGAVVFTASAAKPLIIENDALGYRIQFFLDELQEYKGGTLTYLGISRFEELTPEDIDERKEWEQNRRNTYLGSVHHFLTSLVSGTFEEEGFFLYNTPKPLINESELFKYFRIKKTDDLFSSTELPFERKLHFKDYLNVFYERRNQSSGIKLNYDSAIITTTGYFSERYPIKTYGYWGSMRMADILPFDYEPFSDVSMINIHLVDSLLVVGDSLLANDQFEAAKQAYEKALQIDENSVPAKEGLELVALELAELKKAEKKPMRISQNKQTELEDHYNRGIRYRESGKFKVLLLRKLDWDKSKKHFQWVIAQDSLYKDVLYQYALLLRYREKYEQAITTGHAQVRLRPDLVEPQVKLFNIYRHYITHRGRAEVVSWLKQQPWDHARYFIGEKFRRDGLLEKADSLFQTLLTQPLAMPKQAIYLSLAKIYYNQNLPEKAESYWGQAVQEIKHHVSADLIFEDVKYIVSDSELETYLSLSPIQRKMEFFRSMWIRRDPTPAAQFNVRLAEHYRRLLFSEKHYEYDGFRGWYNNPDKSRYLKLPKIYEANQEFNDKGLVYIRHGEPDDKILTGGEDVPFNESWLYYKTQIEPQMTFHFTLENSTSYWRFTPFLSDPELLEDRLSWGSIYYKLLTASEIEKLPYMNEMAMESQAAVETGLSTDRHSWQAEIKPLDILFSTATFRGKNNRTILEFYGAVPLRRIIHEVKQDGRYIEFEKGFSIHDQNWNQIVREQKIVNVPIKEDGTFIDFYHYEIPSGEYNMAFYSRPIGSDFLGGSKFQQRIEAYSTAGLAMSDIQLANRIEPVQESHKFVKHDLLIVPNPSHFYSRQVPIYLYFEIYNLSQDANGNTSFQIEYILKLLKHSRKGFKKLFSFLGGGQSSITLSADREGKDEFSAEYLSIDVTNAEKGEYELAVKVIDLHTEKSFERTTKLTLF